MLLLLNMYINYFLLIIMLPIFIPGMNQVTIHYRYEFCTYNENIKHIIFCTNNLYEFFVIFLS